MQIQKINPEVNGDGGTAWFDGSGGAAESSTTPSHLQMTAHTAVGKVLRPNTTSLVLPSLHVNGHQLASRVSHTRRGGMCFVLHPNTRGGGRATHMGYAHGLIS